MAPNWMEISNNLVNSSFWIPSRELVMIICPVEETGRNSVNPSTTAIIIASMIFMNVGWFTGTGR
jgi:hypothetical protein